MLSNNARSIDLYRTLPPVAFDFYFIVKVSSVRPFLLYGAPSILTTNDLAFPLSLASFYKIVSDV